MQAYDKEKVANGFLVSEAKELYKMKFISKTQLADIASQLPLLNSSGNILVRIGFFLLGCFLFSSAIGSATLLFMPILDDNFEGMTYFYAVLGIIGTEVLAAKKYHKHGLDDALILAMQIAICSAIGVTFELAFPVYLAMIVVGILSCLRYVNTLSALITCIGITGLFFDLITTHNIMDKLFLPFVGFLLAIGLYVVYKKLSTVPEYYIHRNALLLTKIFALALGYFSLNYMVVRELSESLMGITVEGGGDIPLAFIFYGTTFIIPLGYIAYSLRTKDRIMLLTGLLTLGYSFFTIRYYHQLMPLEVALLLGGALLFGIAYLAIKKLQDKETGVTFKPDRGSDNALLLNAQALIISSQIDMKPAEAENKMTFGGGGFSGGGAGENY